jgi:RNA polymerase sigma factor (sigma-70 family)
MAYAERISYEPDVWADDRKKHDERGLHDDRKRHDERRLHDERENHIAAFNKLVPILSPTIKRIAQKLSLRFSFMDKADLYQEALLYVWTTLGTPGSKNKTDSYILQGCYFHLRNHIRTMQDNVTLLNLSDTAGEDGVSLEETLPWEGISAYDELEGKLQIEALVAHGMTDQELAVLRMSLEDLTTREIGKRLGVSHVRVVKIKNKIRDQYRNVVTYSQEKTRISSPVRDGIQA